MNRLRLCRRLCLSAAAMMAFSAGADLAIAWPPVPLAQSSPEGQKRGAPNTRQDAPAEKADGQQDGPRSYMGRPIADVMSWQGAEWLFRETRIDEEQPEAMLRALKIPRGATVADVLATDVQPEMLEMLRNNAREAGVANIKRILATQSDTKLPVAKVDLILMVDVYHECSHPETMLNGFVTALKPGGRLVLVEFRGEDPEVPIKPEHKMTLKQVRREVEPRGFVFKESLEFLPWQHVIIFEKPAAPKKDSTPAPKQPPPVAREPKSHE
jgi:SAM-dependent methyltransferase